MSRRPSSPRSRLVGLDVARCLALLGMVAVHVLDPYDETGAITTTYRLTGGCSSALFAVLAGVGLALATGGRTPVSGRDRWARSAGFAVRALLVSFVGLLLGSLNSGLAVVLTYYGLLFAVGLAFVGLGARALALAGATWAVLAPVASRGVRPGLGDFDFAVRGASPAWCRTRAGRRRPCC